MAKLENIKQTVEIEQNEFANPDRAQNGGGYFQPYLEFEFDYDGSHYRFIIDDTSCGDFGERYSKSLIKIDGDKLVGVAGFYLNNMESDAGYNGPYGEGDFTKSELTNLLCEAGLLRGYEVDVPNFDDDEDDIDDEVEQ